MENFIAECNQCGAGAITTCNECDDDLCCDCDVGDGPGGSICDSCKKDIEEVEPHIVLPLTPMAGLDLCTTFRILESKLDKTSGVRTITKADIVDISVVPIGTKPTNDPRFHQQIHPLNEPEDE